MSSPDTAAASEKDLTAMLDKMSDTKGLSNLSDATEDWTDVKHSERKKRDRILADGVVLKLMQKSDYQGFKRLFENLAIMGVTAYAIHRLDVYPLTMDVLTDWHKMAIFVPLYLFYGFQFQAFAFAGQHEFLHGNAFKTKRYNDYVLFIFSCVCFEFGTHERLMHKQHHTFTNNIDKDPELTSYFSREELETPGFRNVPLGRYAYFKQFLDVWSTWSCRVLRIINSARGIPVDYSGRGWSMQTEPYSPESGLMQSLQIAARKQLAVYAIVFGLFGQTKEGLAALAFWWFVPVIIGYPAVNYVRNLEHADCEVSKEMNCLKNTRTVESNWLVRQLLWDTNFHVEHHAYPMVPFFNLHKLHELMDGHIEHNETKCFTAQNWACCKPGGWIDQQASFAEEHSEHAKAS